MIDIIKTCPVKSSSLDPIPTSFLKRVATTLVNSFAKLANLSFSSSVFPASFKVARITPLLKKPSLDPEKYEYYRPISNFSIMPKLLDRLALRRLLPYATLHHNFVPVQSAYRQSHSTETALLKIFSDLVKFVDGGTLLFLHC